MSADQVITLLKTLKHEHGINDITFYDDEFVIDKRRMMTVCDGIRELDITWTCEARVDQVNAEVLRSMKAAGCRLINYGIESGNQRILDTLRKHTTIGRIREAVESTLEAGIGAAGYFMLGCPGETKESMSETLNFSRDLNLTHAQFSICTPLPGSEMYSQYIENGGEVIDRYLGGDDCKVAFVSEELSAEDIIQAVNQGNGLFAQQEVKV